MREKYLSPKDFYEDALEAVQIARAENIKIIINDRVDIAFALKADGVHLGQDDLSPVSARKILGENAIIGVSTHNLEQLAEAVKLPIDYAAIGPIFATKTKENPDEIIGIKIVEKARKIIGDFPLVTIGGINSANFTEILNAGADSVAIISDLLFEPDEISQKLKSLTTLANRVKI